MQMQKIEIQKHSHLDERTIQFGMLCMWVCEQLPKDYAGKNIADQLFRSSTSVAANYAESSEPESDADFIHRIKIAMKELKESRVWLRFAREMLKDPYIDDVVDETVEIQRMMGASLKKRGYKGWSSKHDKTALSKPKPNTEYWILNTEN